MSEMISRTLDVIGLFCPEPVLRARQEIDKLDNGKVLEVIADDPGTLEDIPRLVKRFGHQLLEIHEEENRFHFFIRKSK